MDAQRRGRAMRRREMLLLRQKRKDEARQAREVGRFLCEQGMRWVRVPAKRVFEQLRPKLRAPAIDERFDWPNISNASIQYFANAEATTQLQTAIARYTSIDDRVVVVFHTHESAIRLNAADLMRHLPAIMERPMEFWIVSADPAHSWLVDYNRMHGEVCHAAQIGEATSD